MHVAYRKAGGLCGRGDVLCRLVFLVYVRLEALDHVAVAALVQNGADPSGGSSIDATS